MNHKMERLNAIESRVYRIVFWNPSASLMNQNYWTDEFIDEIDSDSILMI